MRRFVLWGALITACVWISLVHAESSGGFSITYAVVAPAAHSSSGAFAMTSTVGQLTVDDSSAGPFRLESGFAASVPSDVIFTNGFEP